MAAPILESAVLRVVDEAGLDGLRGGHVGVEAALLCGALCRTDADKGADGGADAVGADDEVVVGGGGAVGKCYGGGWEGDGLTLGCVSTGNALV